MVGKSAEKITDEKIAEVVASMLGVPYKLGGMSNEDGMDCVSFIVVFFDRLGVRLPDSYNGFDRTNYYKPYLSMGGEAKKIFAEYIRSFTKPDVVRKKGDIVIFIKDGDYNFGIYVGRGNVLLNDYRVGNIVVPVDAIEYDGIEYRRLEKG